MTNERRRLERQLQAIMTSARRLGRQLQAGKQKSMIPALSAHRKTRSASKQQQQQQQEEVNRRIEEFPGFDVGDVPPNDFRKSDFYRFPLRFESCWTENSPNPAPKKYEDMAKIGLDIYNSQNGTLYQFTKILGVDSLTKCIYAAYHITFQAEDESSPKNFEAKAGSIRDITVVPFCKLEKGLDVAASEGDREQTETLFAQVYSAFMKQQLERQQLLREENKCIKERRGFDFGDIPSLEHPGLGTYEPCWSESSLFPAPKLYEDMSKIGIQSYNCEYHTSYQFTKLLRVYFRKEYNQISRFISFQAEDTSVAASPKNFKILVVSVLDKKTLVNGCRLEEAPDRAFCKIAAKFGWYWSSEEYWYF